MAWGLVSSAVNRAATAFAFPARILNSRSADTAGPVPSIEAKARQRAMRLSEREILIAQLREARRLHKPTYSISRRLVRLTAELAGE